MHENEISSKFIFQHPVPLFREKNASMILYFTKAIRHFHIAHNTLCLPPKILHKHCFQFLLGLYSRPKGNLKHRMLMQNFGRQKECIIGNVEMANTVFSRLNAPSIKFKPGRVVDEAFCSLFESGFY